MTTDITNKKLAIANMKMNLVTEVEVNQYLENFIKSKKELKTQKTQLILCPPAIFLERFAKKIKSSQVSLGAQNCFWERKGAFTGEISPEMIKTAGAEFVILGHSERRFYLGENDQIVGAKVKEALRVGLRPIICVGENAQEKKRDMIFEVLLKQLKGSLSDVSVGKVEKVILCYEPVWAISANNPDHLPSNNEIMGAKLIIKKFLVERYGRITAERVKIIYGGSVDSRNINEACLDSGMEGALIGKASLLPHELIKIAEILGN